MASLEQIAAVADPDGLREPLLAQQEARRAKADKYRMDANIYHNAARPYVHARSKVGQEAFAKYTRMADTAAAKADAYERGDEDAIARIEADDAMVDAVLGGGR